MVAAAAELLLLVLVVASAFFSTNTFLVRFLAFVEDGFGAVAEPFRAGAGCGRDGASSARSASMNVELKRRFSP